MAKKLKRRSPAVRYDDPLVGDEVKQSVFAILLAAFGAILLLAFFGMAGSFGASLDGALAAFTRQILIEVNLVGLPQEALTAIQAALRLPLPAAGAGDKLKSLPVALDIRADKGKRFRIAAGREFMLLPDAATLERIRALPGVVACTPVPKPVSQAQR